MTNTTEHSNDNVIAFPRAMTGGSQFDPGAVVRRTRQYAAKPARIIADTLLNQRIMELEDADFTFHIYCGRVLFTHPFVDYPMTLSEAWEKKVVFAMDRA